MAALVAGISLTEFFVAQAYRETALRAVPRRDQIQRAQSVLFRAPVVAEARRARASVRRLGRRPREAAWAPVRPRPVHRRAGANHRLAGGAPVKLGRVTERSHEIL